MNLPATAPEGHVFVLAHPTRVGGKTLYATLPAHGWFTRLADAQRVAARTGLGVTPILIRVPDVEVEDDQP